tara:strand:+ start:289 stop:537 length:249 start_codon:yes stop_codon:yes gene_type:complete
MNKLFQDQESKNLPLKHALETIAELDATRESAKRLTRQAENARREIEIFSNTLKTLEREGQEKVSIGFVEGLLQSISEQLKD